MPKEGQSTGVTESRTESTSSPSLSSGHRVVGEEEEEWVRTFRDPQLTRALEIPHIPSPGRRRESPKKTRVTLASASDKRGQSTAVAPSRDHEMDLKVFQTMMSRFCEIHARVDRLHAHVDLLQRLFQCSKEVVSLGRTQLDSFCLEAFFESSDPKSVQENRILRELLGEYLGVDYRLTRSTMRTWFRRRRDEYGSKIVHSFEAVNGDGLRTQEALIKMRDQIMIAGLDKDLLKRIGQLISLKLDRTPEALTFCTSEILGHLSKVINNPPKAT